MTAALAAPTSTTASIQVGGVDQITLNSAGGGTLRVGPTAGDRTLAMATMKMFADEFTMLKNSQGWQKLPSGLIIQWGTAQSETTFSYPIAFPSAAVGISASHLGGSYAGVAIDNTSFTRTGCRFNAASVGGGGMMVAPPSSPISIIYMVVGY